MRSIDDTHIRRLDMTLLVVFDALMARRKMGAVGVELGLTQSAVSHAVGRLRTIFDDPLFVRRGAGVEPTARAQQLALPIAEALTAVRTALRLGRAFDPATAARRFTVASIDSTIAAIAPGLLANLAETAPRCRIVFRTFGQADMERAIADGAADIAVGVFVAPPSETRVFPLFAQDFYVLARRDHPKIAGTLDLDTYCAVDHILVSPAGETRGTADLALERIGRTRRVVAVMPQFMPALLAVSQSDTIVTAPTWVCRRLGPLFDLALHEPPLTIPGFQLGMLVQAGLGEDPAVVWLAHRIKEALAVQGGCG